MFASSGQSRFVVLESEVIGVVLLVEQGNQGAQIGLVKGAFPCLYAGDVSSIVI